MQLKRLVDFHKALADPTRLRILILLSRGPLHGQALAGKLGLSAPTITHHMAKLREASLVTERRDKNTIYFTLQTANLEQSASGILRMVTDPEVKGIREDEEVKHPITRVKHETVSNFLTPEGRLKHLPAKLTKKLAVLEHILREFRVGTKYKEQEVNQIILKYHEDYATIRREFIVHQYMYRENGIYELNPREMWPSSGA